MNPNKHRNNYRGPREFRPFVIKDVTFRKIRLIDESNKYYETFYTEDAKKKANHAGLDLVCFSKGNRKSGELPLCKIVDYGKWKYENGKKEKQKVHQQKHVTKEIQLSMRISDNDMAHKLKQVNKFLSKNMDVKLVMKLFGPDRRHFNLAEEKMQEVVGLCSEFGKVHDTKKADGVISVRLVPV